MSNGGELDIIGTDLAATLVDPNFEGMFSLYELAGRLADGTNIGGATFLVRNGTGTSFQLLAAVPEPSSLALTGLTTAALAIRRRLQRCRRRRRGWLRSIAPNEVTANTLPNDAIGGVYVRGHIPRKSFRFPGAIYPILALASNRTSEPSIASGGLVMRRRDFTDRSLFPRRLCSILRSIGTFLIMLATADESYAANRRWGGGNGNLQPPRQLARRDRGGRQRHPTIRPLELPFSGHLYRQLFDLSDESGARDRRRRRDLRPQRPDLYNFGGRRQRDWQPTGRVHGRLTITDGTWQVTPSGAFVDIGAVANAPGALTVGAGGRISNSPFLIVGSAGPGTLTIQNGGLIPSASITLGLGITERPPSPHGSALGTSLLNVGGASSGTLNINAGGSVQSTATRPSAASSVARGRSTSTAPTHNGRTTRT